MEYDFDLSVVTGKDNLIADVLSRAYPDNPSTFAVPPLPTLNSTEYTDYCALNARYAHPSPQFTHLSPVYSLRNTSSHHNSLAASIRFNRRNSSRCFSSTSNYAPNHLV
jgi:hypothetical protein